MQPNIDLSLPGITFSDTMSWDSIHRWCSRWLGIVATVIVILGAIFTGIKYVVRSEVSEMAGNIKTMGNTLEPLPEAISSLKERTSKMEGEWEGLKVKNASEHPASTESIKAVHEALANAKGKNLKIDPDLVREAGEKFLTASERNPGAWEAAVAFLNYRTFLNADSTPIAPSVSPSALTRYQYSLNLKPNPDVPQHPTTLAVSVTESGGAAPPEDSARMESLDNPNATGSGVRYLIIDGRADIIDLDGQYLKNVIIRNAIVEYDGGQVRLENVYFINCTLRFRPSPQTRDLGRNLLASNSVTFNAPRPS